MFELSIIGAIIAALAIATMLTVFTVEFILELGGCDKRWEKRILHNNLDEITIGEEPTKEKKFFLEEVRERFIKELQRVRIS